jgi:hypothetical protein
MMPASINGIAPLCEGNEALGEPRQVLHSDQGRGFERHQRDTVTITKVMMRGNDHAIAQAALAQCGLEIRNTFVAVGGIVGGGANRRRGLSTEGLIHADANVGHLRAAVHRLGNVASSGVHNHFRFLKDCHEHSCKGAGSVMALNPSL